MARQPWKVTAILWPLLVSAVMPMRLADAAERLPDIADLLDQMEVDPGARQIPTFRDWVYPNRNSDTKREKCEIATGSNY